MSRKIITGIIIAIVALILAWNTLYTVQQYEQVVVVQFGKVVRVETESGLHFKTPGYEQLIRYDKRWIDWDGDPKQITTRDKRYISIDAFARWRIADPLIFVEKLRDEISAQGRLDDIIDSATRNVIANNNLIEAIRTTDRKFNLSAEEKISYKKRTPLTAPSAAAAAVIDGKAPVVDTDSEDTDTSKVTPVPPGATAAAAPQAEASENEEVEAIQYQIEFGRISLTKMILKRASVEAAKLGIELKDVQIKRIDYIESVQATVFDRMISERRKVATRMRSEGEGLSAEILGQKERELKEIRSEAYRLAEEIKGDADAKAARIYAEAYQKDPELYEFLKTMESYRQTIGEETWLLLTTNSSYARYFQSMK